LCASRASGPGRDLSWAHDQEKRHLFSDEIVLVLSEMQRDYARNG
jgi:hypothetical protein